MEQNFTIKNITKNSTNLEVDWSDGKKSKFNYLWLRDNCPTAHDKDSRHRMFNILKVSKLLTLIFPLDCLHNPHIADINVVFPAPFGPNKAKISPSLISSETLFKALCLPNTFETFSIEI